MTTREYASHSPSETIELARRLASGTAPPVCFLLSGELGAGKTQFAKGLAAGYDVEDVDEVSSPTFTLINRYPGRIPIYHIDLYRIEGQAVEGLGLDELLADPTAVVIVEWSERLGPLTPDRAVRVFLSHVDEASRRITVTESNA